MDRELVIGRGYVEGAGGVPPSGGPEDSRDVISESWRGGMVLISGDGGLGGGRAVAYEGIYLEATGYNYGVYNKSTNL